MKKPLKITLISLCALLIGGAVYWFQFNHRGYRMSVPLRPDYDDKSERIYIDKAFRPHLTDALHMLEEARVRVETFWKEHGGGRLVSDPYIILSADKGNLQKLGGDHDTHYHWFPVHTSYISISDEYLNVDILAHELSHAEFQARMTFKGMKKLPTWFDEGLALQNDYREQYSEEEWEKQTDHGKNAVKPEDMDTPEEFYAGEAADRRFRYLCAKHMVTQILENLGKDNLAVLLENCNEIGELPFV